MSQRGQTLLGHSASDVLSMIALLGNVSEGSDPFGTSRDRHRHVDAAITVRV